MTNLEDGNPNGAENDKIKTDLEKDSTVVDVGLDDSKAHLINGGAAGEDHPEKFKTAIVDPSDAGEAPFNGLGKDEVLQYANDPFWVRLRWIMFILFWVGWLVMLVTAIVIIVVAPRCPHRPDLKWYHTDNIYGVVAKSFKDTNGDGLGDFEGLKDEEEYITDDLSTNGMWLSGIYKSDAFGIVDHKELDPTFVDSFGRFKSWVKKMRKKGYKVIMDLIPNHTSKNHTWFVNSVNDKDGKYKDYYVWADGSASTPPNNWKQVDGTTDAWTWDATRGAWYFHKFGANTPDLNLNNQAVVDEIKAIMEYWFDAAVCGFNIQDLEYLVENPDTSVADDADHTQTRNYVGTLALLEQFREIAEDYSDKHGKERVLFGTVKHANRTQIEQYWGPEDNERLDIVAPLMDLDRNCDAECVKTMVEKFISEETEEEQWLGLQVGNQQMSRIATRLYDANDTPDTSYKHRLALNHAIQLLLPGTPLIYYGDEFGQRDGPDSSGAEKYMSPMQWKNTENAGFTDKGVKPWTALSPSYKEDNVEAGRVHFRDELTPYQAYVELTELRKEESFQFGKTKMCTTGNGVLMWSREAHRFPYFIVLANMQEKELAVTRSDMSCLQIKDDAKVAFHSQGKSSGEEIDIEDVGVHLEPFDVVVLEFAANS